ncbi:LamG-like jellyroll fold domain-containing protein [Actinomycetospora succinea]|uniref:LamG-like jellyroll fold domain-containing protein n=1 Tax=Actinomycetospora succinea TaxID=663603 RepID=UPI001061C431|nr:LamG-like jellyroll fold domain-containing protein [Actinomycetospora succinea]
MLAATVVVVLFAGALVWHLSGGRWQIITTPSMGTAAPVGSVVLTRPDTVIGVGEIVTFRPPAELGRSVTHRVVALETGPGGIGMKTRGDINGAVDPWTLHAPDLTGRVVLVLPGLGWLMWALPALIVGIVLLFWATRRWLPWLWAVPTRVLGLSLLLAAVSVWLRPFVGTVTLGSSADAGEATINLVSTGMLPTRVSADTGGVLDLVSGEKGVLVTPRPEQAGGNVLTSGVHMPWWLWIVMTAFWLLPMVYGLIAAHRHPLVDDAGPTAPGPPPAPPAPSAPDPGPRRGPGATSTFLGMALALALTIAPNPTLAAFTGTLTNTTNTAGAAPYFTCLGATAGFGSNYIAWPLDDANVANLATARSLTGGTTGTYNGLLGFTAAATRPCPRDTPARAVTINGSAVLTPYVATTSTTAIASTNVFSIVGWFRTNTVLGGRMIGWGSSRTGLTSGGYDRHLYMTNSGQLTFGVYPNATKTITSPNAYNDDAWHLAVATLSPAGMVLYVDGAQVAADPTTTTAEGGTTRTGWWRVGWDNLNGWPNAPTTYAWAGSMYDAAVMTTALTPAQVTQLYRSGT